MLRTDHRSIPYQPPAFAGGQLSARPRSYAGILLHFGRVVEMSPQNNPMKIDNAGDVPLEELLQIYEPVRTLPASRRLQGESLSQREQLVLTKLNQMLSIFFDHPRPEPPAVTQAVEEAKRLLHQLEHGQN